MTSILQQPSQAPILVLVGDGDSYTTGKRWQKRLVKIRQRDTPTFASQGSQPPLAPDRGYSSTLATWTPAAEIAPASM